ncbi:hypothetical protein [Pradoshia sp.]
MQKYDYERYVILYNVGLPDGRIVLKDAFEKCNGREVPIVYNMYQNGGTHIPDTSPDNVLGMALLENRDDGIYARCRFYDNPVGMLIKNIDPYKCIKRLTVYANLCEVNGLEVTRGIIRAVKVISK